MMGKKQKYMITKAACKKRIYGVCEGCGGTLEPIETVDNSGQPTYWQGCNICSCFRGGVKEMYFKIARQLVVDGSIRPYSHMQKSEYEDSPEALEYYYSSQTASLSHNVAHIHRLIQDAEATP